MKELIVGVLMVAMGIVIYFSNKDTRTKFISQQQTIDSLQTELFIQKTNLGRYELALEDLKEYNPKAAQEFTLYLNNKE